MLVSIIIPTHNRQHELLQAMRSLQEQVLTNFEIIVVDNAVDPAIKEMMVEFNRTARLPAHYVPEPRLGLHYARHAGARAAMGEILVFTDDDATFDGGWLKAYANAFEAHPLMVAAGGPVRPVWEVPPPQWLIEFMSGSKRLNILSLMESYQEFRLDQKGLFFGVNMAIRREVLFAVGGFNPEAFGDIWLGDGEIGLNRKLSKRGMPVGYVPDAIVYHHIPAQRMTIDYFCRRMANEGACAMYSRFHHGASNWLSLCAYAAPMAIKNCKYWLADLFVRGRTDIHSLRIRLQASRTKSQFRYVLRLMHDNDLRKLVLKEDWLNE